MWTSNSGDKYVRTEGKRFQRNEKNIITKKKIMNEVKLKLSPEFINRLDEMLLFAKLGKSHVAKVVDIQLKQLKKRLRLNNIFIEWDKAVNDTIALNGYDPEYGARPIKRKIREVVEDKITEIIMSNDIKEGDTLLLYTTDNTIKIREK